MMPALASTMELWQSVMKSVDTTSSSVYLQGGRGRWGKRRVEGGSAERRQ
jgi:hypothetical protein